VIARLPQRRFPHKYLFIFTLLLILISCKSVKTAEQDDDIFIDDEQYLIADERLVNEKKVSADRPGEQHVFDGFVRLVLNEKSGSFSLSCIPNSSSSLYESLFISRNPKSSYMSISVNGKIYQLGASRIFTSSIVRQNGNPALVFESGFLTVTQEFAPVKSGNSMNANGVMITIDIMNTSEKNALVGLRFLLDTELGEKRGMTPFVTHNRIVTAETLLNGDSGERYWMSKGESVSLMGSIVNPVDSNSAAPDYVHFANWKRLNDAPWKLRYAEGRSFSSFPYSMNDSAVCYYYEPVEILSGSSLAYKIFLTTEDAAWYYPHEQGARSVYIISESTIRTIDVSTLEEAAFLEAMQSNENPKWLTLKRIQEILNQFLIGDIVLNENDMAEIERIINLHRNEAR